ncbi:MAG: HYR domain-containing protein [Saprospiraceae bacterium]|nr:HYR domain-containing protein [Saprospiraceae bacterium]
MNETNSTRFSTIGRMLAFFMVFFIGTFNVATAQSVCACKGAIQVSVDENCTAAISADMILTNGSTCGGSTTATVTLMKTPTGNIISTGVGFALLPDGPLYIGKTIYGKVTEGTGINSCWTTILIEDKLAPTIECPEDLTLNCYQLAGFCPIVTENCSHYTINVIAETITVNDCRPITGLPDEVLKVITRTYQAVDASGNKSLPCTMTITVEGLPTLDEPYITMPYNRWLADSTELQCDEDYARIPAGQPYAGNPSPVDIKVGNVTKYGTGVPHLLLWNPSLFNAGSIDGDAPGSLTLIGGTDLSQPNVRVLGAQLCFNSIADQTITFDWSAFMQNSLGIAGGQFMNDEPVFAVNGIETNLPSVVIGVNVASGTRSVALEKGDEFCFRVYTDNLNFHTFLTVSNMRSDVATALPIFYLPIYPTPDLYCNILVSFSDVKLPTIGCVTKILRTWFILEWSCRGTQRIRTHLQMIEIVDKTGPQITCPLDFTASTNGHSCEANVAFPAAIVKDNCSPIVTVDITYPGGFIKSVNGGFGKLPVGCHTITYTAYDACYNSTSCTINVVVEDNTPPVAICDQNTVIGLTLDGKAWVPATSFDDGSYDECDLSKMLVRRMNPSACKPCKTPEFPGFTYLGEYFNSNTNEAPHYYYISKHRATPDIAIKTAVAMGGYVVAINTATEDSWLYDKVQQWNLGDDYLIGLRDIKQKGLFAWLSGENSIYRNWTAGSPQDVLDGHNDYDYVRVLDGTGKWYDFGSVECQEQEWLYVVEITDPCGFSAYAQFCCTDVATSPHMVQFRVIDKAGNWNDCMVNAFVQDKLPPSIVCPPHMTVTCNDIFDIAKLRHSFGWPTVYDNCENPRITQDSVIDMNSCRIGRITRTFTATDAGGRSATCTQIIIVNGLDTPFVMTPDRWPADVNISGCEDPNDEAFDPDNTGRPNLTADNICTLVGAHYEDQIFTFNNTVGEACFKILRHWTVIDWCQRIALEGGGFYFREWTHTQIIKVHDPIKPVITSSCARKSVCTFDPTCQEGYIELSASATDVCTIELRWSYKIDLYNDGSFEPGLSNSGLGNSVSASGNYPVGNHKIVWAFEDRCGNVTKCEQLFDVVNCKSPTPYCLNGLATSLMPVDTNDDGIADAGMIEIWASDFDNGSAHPCGYPVLLSFEPVTLDAQKHPVVVPNRTFTCDDVGNVTIRLYAAVVTPMGTVVQDYCSTFISIQDNNNVCPDTDGRVINGTLTTETEVPVKDVNVALEGSEMNAITGQSGSYNFTGMQEGASYVVKPRKNDDPLNGVSTLDLVMIQRHILNIAKLDSPYKLIAADVNKDQKIAASDLNELRKVILGITTHFENNDSWRFADKNYIFQEPGNAHGESFPEVYYIPELNADFNVNFTSIKVGDVNGNVVANTQSVVTESRSARSLSLTTDNQKFTAGQSVQIPVIMSEDADVSGFQFTVNFDTELFSLESLNGGIIGMTDNNFGFARLSDGIVTVSFNRENAFELLKGDHMFTLTLKAKANGLISQGLWIDSSLTPAEAYTQDNEVMNVDFNVSGRTSDAVVLYQNTPNPFKAVTMIGFDLPKAMNAKLSIYDVTGKVVKVINDTFLKGYNSIEINKNELGSVGILYYTLEADDFKATRKMVVIE